MKVVTLYAIGVGAVVFGFYEYWHDGTVNQNAFTAGALFTVSAAGLQVARDIWRRLGRR